MSDLAPFVAATLRDRVMNDLQQELDQAKEENERLEIENERLQDQRNQEKEQIGLHGSSDNNMVLIFTSPPVEWEDEPVVYGYQELRSNNDSDPPIPTPIYDFIRMREITLLELMNAHAFVNGERLLNHVLPYPEFTISFSETQIVIPARNASRQELLHALGDNYKHILKENLDFQVVMFSESVAYYLIFPLENIDEDRLVQFLQETFQDHEPGSVVDDLTTGVSMQRAVECFGPNAKVLTSVSCCLTAEDLPWNLEDQ